MAVFDAPTSNYPAKWKDYSFDFKLMFVYHGCMMMLFMTGGTLSVQQELLATMLMVAVLLSLSLRHRREMHWRWRGVQAKNVLAAAGILLVASLFDFAAVPNAPPSDPRFLPWHMAGIGIAAFGILNALNVIQMSKSEFLKQCETPDFHSKSMSEEVPTVPTDPLWKRTLRATYAICFLLVWAAGVASFYYFGVGFRNGSPRPTPTQTEPLNNHGQIVYIPHAQKALIDSLQTVMAVGIPSVLLGGLILHFFVGVKLFANAPTFAEWKKQRLVR